MGYSLAVVAAMLVGFPGYGDWGPPKSAPVPVRSAPSIGPDARDLGHISKEVRTEIRSGRDNGALSHKEARELRREEAAIDALESRYAQDGLSDSEFNEILNRLEALHSITYAKSAPGKSR